MPGIAVFPHPGKDTTPLALRANVEHNHVLHESVIIVSASTANVPHVPASEAFTLDDLGYDDDGIQHLSVRYGFSDEPEHARGPAGGVRPGCPGAPRDRHRRRVVLPVARGHPPDVGAGLARWRKTLFLVLAHNAADPAAYFALPRDRTVLMGTDVEI